MDTVKLSDGYEDFEATVYYVDGSRSYLAAVRRRGEMWWTPALRGACGHAHTLEAERFERARIAAEHEIRVRWQGVGYPESAATANAAWADFEARR